jgi:ABC transporter substrate binding protein
MNAERRDLNKGSFGSFSSYGIVTNGTAATVALQRETRTIPIVFAGVGDPVASGIVARFDRPSGNVTGFANAEATLGGKWLELLSEIAPGLKRAAIMFNPDTSPASSFMPSFEMAAQSLKVVPIPAPVHSGLFYLPHPGRGEMPSMMQLRLLASSDTRANPANGLGLHRVHAASGGCGLDKGLSPGPRLPPRDRRWRPAGDEHRGHSNDRAG